MRANRFIRFLKSYIIFIMLLVILFISPAAGDFYSLSNIITVLRVGALLAILSCGQALVMICSADGIDLSMGAVMAYSAYIGTLLVRQDHIAFGIIVAILLGLGAGAANGFLISRLRMPAFAATFAVGYMVRAIGYFVAQGIILYDLPERFRVIATGYLFGIPVVVFIMVAVVLIIWFILTRTQFGRSIYCVGTNESAAIACGLNPKNVTMWVYIISGIIAGLAGMLFTARLNAAETTFGEEYVIQTVAACILGGIIVGRGNIGRVIIGAYILSIISNGMNLLAIDSAWQDLVFGAILIIGLLVTFWFDRLDNRLLNRRLMREMETLQK